MMSRDEFLRTAHRLLAGATEGDWRSAVSRAYYAVFHFCRLWFQANGLPLRRSGADHHFIYQCLNNSGHASVVALANRFPDLQRRRTGADYELHQPVSRVDATAAVTEAG